MTKPADTESNEISRLKAILAEQILDDQKHEYCIDKINKYEEEVSSYREGIILRDEMLSRKEEELAKAKAYAERLEEMVRLLRHGKFGRKSEALKDDKQIPLGIFNEAEEALQDAEEDTPVEVKAHKRRGKPKRIKLPPDLPREDLIIDLTEEEKICPEGHKLECIGEDISEQLDVVPAQIKVIRTIRKKYACKCCEGHVKRAPAPKVAIPKSMASAGLLAYIATSKYGDGLPLYRQEHMWQRLGVELPRETMATWMIKVGELLTPLINLMEEDILESGYVQADETRVQVLDEPGKRSESLSYMWVRGRNYPGAPPIVIFEYDPTRAGSVAKRLFAGYSGYLQADAYGGYNGICESAKVIRCGCMAHARRKFFETTKASKKGLGVANEVIGIIAELYKIEGSIKDKDVEERHNIRQEMSVPIMEKLKDLIDEKLQKVPPKSQLGMALLYAHNEWTYLARYLEDGRLSIDNNFVENTIRPFAVGRKNWLFSASVAGAKASAAIYSIMVSAKLNGHNEYLYFRHILEKLPLADTAEEFEALLPHILPPQDITAPSS